MEEKKVSLIQILISFIKVGALTFGGGYAMLPIIEREIINNKSWVTKEEVLDYYAVAQSIPGLIGINTAVMIGHKKRGVVGGIFAAIGVMIPCIVVITVIAGVLSGFRENVYVKHALSGISVCVIALVVGSIISLWKKAITDIPQFLICLLGLAISIFTNASPIFCIIGAAVLGVIINLIIRRKNK